MGGPCLPLLASTWTTIFFPHLFDHRSSIRAPMKRFEVSYEHSSASNSFKSWVSWPSTRPLYFQRSAVPVIYLLPKFGISQFQLRLEAILHSFTSRNSDDSKHRSTYPQSTTNRGTSFSSLQHYHCSTYCPLHPSGSSGEDDSDIFVVASYPVVVIPSKI